MFGIGGGELIFIVFIVLMLFGSDKIPEIARTMGKAMSQLKDATNDIKSEIQKGAEANGFDAKSLSDITGNFRTEMNKAKDSILNESTAQVESVKENVLGDSAAKIDSAKQELEDITGPIKRQM